MSVFSGVYFARHCLRRLAVGKKQEMRLIHADEIGPQEPFLEAAQRVKDNMRRFLDDQRATHRSLKVLIGPSGRYSDLESTRDQA